MVLTACGVLVVGSSSTCSLVHIGNKIEFGMMSKAQMVLTSPKKSLIVPNHMQSILDTLTE